MGRRGWLSSLWGIWRVFLVCVVVGGREVLEV